MQIRQILDGVESLDMVMPEFQREYVWSLDDAKQLMSSMFNGYPTGCLLFWETENPPEIKNSAVDITRLGLTKVILDGQQRLTTLFMLINGKIPPYYTEEDINNDPRHLFFNALTGEFAFYQKTRMENSAVWCSVINAFNEDKIDAFDIAEKYCEENDTDFKETNKIVNSNLQKLRAIPKALYPILTVPKSASIDDAIDVFDKVNSRGTKLTEAELVLTHITGRWPKARRVMKSKILEFQKIGFDFQLDFLTRLVVIKLTGSALFSKKNSKLKYDNFTKNDYKSSWEAVSKALDYLVPILQQDALISSTNDLNTVNVLVPLVSYLLKNDLRFKGDLKYRFLYWMFLALIWQRYSGQTDQRLDKDVNIINNRPEFITSLISEIEDDRGRVEVRAADLEGRGAGHALYKMLYIVTKANKAIDWANGGAIYGTIGDYYSIQSHHIFPQGYLYKNGYDSENHLHRKKVNETANRAFITRDTNYSISDSPPADYLPQIEKEYPSALDKQFIPANAELWTASKYEEFLQKRREIIASEINNFLDELKNHSADEPTSTVERSWEEIIANDEDSFTEFKSTLTFCLKQQKRMDHIEHSVLKTINAFMNSEGGLLFIGVANDHSIVGLEQDYIALGNKGKDGFLLHFDNLVIRALGKEQQSDIAIRIVQIGGKDVAIVEVSSSNKPVFLSAKNSKEFFVRHAASSQSYDVMETSEYISKHWQ